MPTATRATTCLLALCLVALPLAASACGTAGTPCCAAHVCQPGHGSCLFTSADAQGTCTEFGGLYAGVKARCDAGNSYAGDQCVCPAGFAAVCAPWSVITDDSGTVSASELCACGSSAAGQKFTAYGGMFATDDKGACVLKNPLSGACTCAAGTTAMHVTSTVSKVTLCSKAGAVAASGLAGVFQEDAAGKCLTGSCACESAPSGFSTCPFGGLNALPNGAAAEIGMTSSCWVGPEPQASAVIAMKTAAISRVFQEGVRGEIALNQKIELPNFSGHDYSVSGIVFTSLTFTVVNASISGENEISLHMGGGSMLGSIGRIEVKKDFIKTHCDAHPFNLAGIEIDMTLHDASLKFPGGRLGFNPGVHARAIKSSVATVNVDVHGHTICDLFKGTIEGKIRDAVKSAFTTTVPSMIANFVPETANYIGQNVSSYPTTIEVQLPTLFGKRGAPVQTSVFADMSLQGCGASFAPPSATDKMPLLALELKASAFTSKPEAVAFTAPPMTPISVDLSAAMKAGLGDKDAVVCLTESPLDALSWAAYASDAVKYLITPDYVPASSPLQLNTSNMFLAQIAPEMAALFPNDAVEIEVSCGASSTSAKAPTFKYGVASGNTIAVSTSLDLKWKVRTLETKNDTKHCVKDQSDKSFVCEIFDTQLQLTVNASFSVQQPGGSGNVTIAGQILSLDATWAVLNSQVGTIAVSVLESLDGLVLPTIISDANAYLKNNTLSISPTVGGLSLTHVARPTLMATNSGAAQLCFGADVKFQLAIAK